jgi:endoglucanase
MRIKLLIITLLTSFHCFSQVIYNDEFNQGINSFQSTTSLTTSLNNNNLTINGNGTSGAWDNITYDFHNSGTNTTINASSSPKIYLKIKAENSPVIRVDFLDSNGYSTTQYGLTATPTSEFQIYELNYTDKLLDGGYGGPCTSGPCNVDASQLVQLALYINPGSGNYSGEIEIEWISIGESLETVIDYDIRYNQIGYFPNKSKYINLVSINNFSPKNYQVLDANDNVVLNGTSETVNYWNDGGEYVSKVNVSSITSPGVYKFKTNELEINFEIGSDIYTSLSEASLKYYYYNRASTSISSTYGGAFTRNLGHPDNIVYVHSSAASQDRPTGTIISSPKGWYDAGDYNKYIVNSGISTYTLLAAYEHYESYYSSKNINIPETGGNIPDILDEVKWNLDWMLTMQEASDGGVYHKLTGLNFSGIIMPENYNLDRYVVQKSTSAALNFAAVMATASRIFSDFETQLPGYSAALLNAAQSAYNWAKQNPNSYFTNPAGVSTGEYGDNDVSDEFQWAAVELYITTGNSSYNNDINVSTIGDGTPSWRYTDPLALISILYHKNNFSTSIVNSASNTLVNTANQIKSHIENSTMNISMGVTNWDYVWGSNSEAANKILMLIRAYEFTQDISYLNAAYIATDYLFGRNGTGYCYVTGFGVNRTKNPHHRISEADQVTDPIPGMLAGGPNPGQQDGCSGYLSNSNAGSYTDDWCSYASNEVTINWNAPLAYSVNALHFYENGVTLNVDNFQTINNDIVIYPNPTNGISKIKININIESVTVYDNIGKIIYNGNSKILNLSNYSRGLYFVKIKTTRNKIFTKKLFKE